jgi:hypothetical protein
VGIPIAAVRGNPSGDFRFNAVLSEELAKVSAALASTMTIHTDVVVPYLMELCMDDHTCEQPFGVDAVIQRPDRRFGALT